MSALSFETLASGYGLVEGPTCDREGGVYFSDVLGGGVHHWRPDGDVETVIPKRRGVGGVALHAEGGLVVSGRDVIHVKEGTSRTLLHVDGVAGWNDLCTDPSGAVYAGALRFAVFDPEAAEVAGECWRAGEGGRVDRLYEGVVHGNGMAVSPDGGTLVHADTRRALLIVHDLAPDGEVSNRRELASEPPGHPDGLAFDEEGRLWLAIAGGARIDRIDIASGERIGSFAVPANLVTSLCFAGPERRDLIVVTGDRSDDRSLRGSVLRTRAPVAGAPVSPARV